MTFQQLLDDGLLEIGDGYRAKNDELGGDGPIFLRAGHVTDSHIDFEGVERFHSSLVDKVRHKMAKPGDTIVTTKGNSTGRTSYVTRRMPPFVYSPHLSYWRSADPTRIHNGFLRYWARGLEFGNQLAGMKASTDMAPYLSLTDQRRLRISLPAPEQQQAIADLLGALDDKIELNRRMNATLEATARAIFKSWFVDFDPVRAKMDGRHPAGMSADLAALFPDSLEHVDGELAPKGWRRGPLGELAKEDRHAIAGGPFGSKLSRKHYTEAGVPVIRGSNMSGDSSWFNDRDYVFVSEEKAETLSTNMASPGDLIFTQRGTLGQVAVIPTDAEYPRYVVSQSQMKMTCNADTPSTYVYLYFRQDSTVAYILANATASGVPHINLTFLRSFPILIPSMEALSAFGQRTAPLVASITANSRQSCTLASIRDALLPKLLLGELRVWDAERVVEEVVQMATTPAQIDLWLQADSETQNLEFKKAEQSYSFNETCEYAVAIANEGGGHLLLGVTNKKPRQVLGSVAFPNLIKTAMQLFNKVGFRVDVEEVMHPDGRVVVFTIPSRPRGTAYDLDGRYLMRSGEGKTAMTEDRLRAIFAEGTPDWLEETSRDDLSAQEVIDCLDTQKFFELLNRPFPSSTDAILEHLVGEKLVDQQEGGYAIRRMGGLLLARRLTDFPDLSHKAPRVVVYDGDSKAKTRRDQTGQMGYAVGFQSLVGFVMSQLPQNEVLQDALRVESPLAPDVAIRELVANALIHQDFSIAGGSVMVEVYSNRVEISNPGDPVVPVDRFIDGYLSRNERLADLMRRLGICEEKSSGIDHVVRTAEVMQLPPPDFRVGHRRTYAVVFGPKPFEQMNRAERVRACYQHCVLRHITREETSNSSLRARFKLGKEKVSAVSQILSAAVEDGLIRVDQSAGGSKSQTRYLPFWAQGPFQGRPRKRHGFP